MKSNMKTKPNSVDTKRSATKGNVPCRRASRDIMVRLKGDRFRKIEERVGDDKQGGRDRERERQRKPKNDTSGK